MQLADKMTLFDHVQTTIRTYDEGQWTFDRAGVSSLAGDLHLRIDQCLKALIIDARGTHPNTHDLSCLYGLLGSKDPASSRAVSIIFADAVRFYGLDTGRKRYEHYASLPEYFAKVGTNAAYNGHRYRTNEPGKHDTPPTPEMMMLIHRELAAAMSTMLVWGNYQTISARVESTVTEKLYNGPFLAYSPNTPRERAVSQYTDWLFNRNANRCNALRAAAEADFDLDLDTVGGIGNDALRTGYQDLSQLTDPAIKHFLRTLRYLPRGSVSNPQGLKVPVKWVDPPANTRGILERLGKPLGYIQQQPNGVWMANAFASKDNSTIEAICRIDAEAWLLHKATSRVWVHTKSGSEEITVMGDVSPPMTFFSSPAPEIPLDVWEIEFWDHAHGLCPSDQVAIEVPRLEEQQLRWIYEADVVQVDGNRVSMEGKVLFVANKDRPLLKLREQLRADIKKYRMSANH